MAEINICLDDNLKKQGDDPFYNPENMRVLAESVRDAEAGKLTVHELIENGA